jgi:hypothetical protein
MWTATRTSAVKIPRAAVGRAARCSRRTMPRRRARYHPFATRYPSSQFDDGLGSIGRSASGLLLTAKATAESGDGNREQQTLMSQSEEGRGGVYAPEEVGRGLYSMLRARTFNRCCRKCSCSYISKRRDEIPRSPLGQTDEAKRRSVWRLKPEPGRSAARAGRGLLSCVVRRGQHAR